MLLDIARIRKNTDGVMPVDFDIDTSGQYSDGISYFSDVHIAGSVKNTVGIMVFKAVITGVYHTRCDRCLCDTELKTEAIIDTIFDIEGSKDDSLTVENGRIDLAKTCFDALILSLPMQIFCENNCEIITES